MADKVKVQKGDTLWDIAQRVYGDGNRYREIAEANDIKDPNKISIGQTLELPGTTAPPVPRMRPTPIRGDAESQTERPSTANVEPKLNRFADVDPVSEGEFAEFSPMMQENARKYPNVAQKLREIQAAKAAIPAKPTPPTPEEAAKEKLRQQLPPAATPEEIEQGKRRRQFDAAFGEEARRASPEVSPRYLGIKSGKPWAKMQGETEAERRALWARGVQNKWRQDIEERGPLPSPYDWMRLPE